MAESADADDPMEPNIGIKCVGCGVGMDAFGSPIGAAAMNQLLIIKLGFVPKKAGFQRTRSAIFPISIDPTS